MLGVGGCRGHARRGDASRHRERYRLIQCNFEGLDIFTNIFCFQSYSIICAECLGFASLQFGRLCNTLWTSTRLHVPRDAQFSSTRVAESRDVAASTKSVSVLTGCAITLMDLPLKHRSVKFEFVRYETPVKQRKW